MKNKSVFSKILLPALIILLILPPVSCGIFYLSAEKYAENAAQEDLIRLREAVIPIMLDSFDSDDEKTPKEKVGSFVRRAGPVIRGIDADTRLLLFAANFKIIYPREEAEKKLAEPAAKAFAEYITENNLDNGNSRSTVKISDNSGENFFASIYIPPSHSKQIEYVVTYCPVDYADNWIKNASISVLLISCAAALFMTGILYISAKHISVQIEYLSCEAKRIGNGDFSHVDRAFDLKEAEELKTSMNVMSDMLKSSRDAQQRFYENISHDLRTPLMAIGGYAQGLETGVLTDSVKAAHVISEESARLTRYVSDLLTLSRLENGEIFELEPVNVYDCLGDVYEQLNGLAVKNGVVLECTMADRNLYVYADNSQLVRIMNNLISNALRYAKRRVTVYAYSDGSESADKVRIYVDDDGCGIKEEELPRIFDRSFKGEKGGFGFGLAIAFNAAKNMNGALCAENRSEGGARFVLTLKRAYIS